MTEQTRTPALPFSGQVAIVTGGAQGLGEGIVKMLVGNGCAVMIFDVNEEKAKSFAESLRAQGHRAESFKVDVAQEQSVREGFAALCAKFDRLDIMVNCAGIVGPSGIKADEVSTEDFDRVYEGKQISRNIQISCSDLCSFSHAHGWAWLLGGVLNSSCHTIIMNCRVCS